MSQSSFTILKFIESIRATTDMDEIMETFITLVKGIFPFHGCALYILDDENNTFVPKKMKTFSEEMRYEVQVMLDEGIIDWIVQEGDAKIIPAKIFQKNKKTKNQFEFIITPLLAGKRVVGVFILLIQISQKEINPTKLDNLFLLANQAASAIENSLLYFDMKRKIKDLEVLFETGKEMSQTTSRSDILDIIINMASQVIQFEYIILFLLYDDAILRPIASQGISIKALLDIEVPLNEGISGWVAKEKQPVMIHDYSTDMRFKNDKTFLPSKVKNVLSAPLLNIGNKLIGVLTLYNSHNPSGFSDDDFRMLSALASYSGIAIERSSLYESLQQGYLETIIALANAIEAKDPYTRGHTVRVTKYALEIAIAMNLSRTEIDIIRYGGILHDIGKIGIPESILLKPAKLNEKEYSIIQTHSVIGEEMIKSVSFLKKAMPIIRHHHERIDGSGYPDGLKGKKIPLSARIMAVADAFDAMTTNRPYRNSMSPQNAIEELQRHSRTQFDFSVVTTLIRIFRTKQLLENSINFTMDDILKTGKESKSDPRD